MLNRTLERPSASNVWIIIKMNPGVEGWIDCIIRLETWNRWLPTSVSVRLWRFTTKPTTIRLKSSLQQPGTALLENVERRSPVDVDLEFECIKWFSNVELVLRWMTFGLAEFVSDKSGREAKVNDQLWTFWVLPDWKKLLFSSCFFLNFLFFFVVAFLFCL